MKFPTWFLAGLLVASVATAIAKSQSASEKLSPAEEWVFACVSQGIIADLREQFPKEKDRKLTAHFLEQLLTGALPGAKPHRNGVRIMGAIIDEPIDLTNAQILCEVWLDHCQFNQSVTFVHASFSGNVSFKDSTFKAAANFDSIKVGHNALFSNALFEGSVDFPSADIASHLDVSGAKFQNREKETGFTDMKVGGYAFFTKAVFEGPVNFSLAGINFLIADEAQFQNKEKGARFTGMKVSGYALFKKAVFEGPVNFIYADIAHSFTLEEAQFRNKENGVSFSGMKVGGDAVFRKTVFEREVDFSSADIAVLDVSRSVWPKAAGALNIQGMSYKYVCAAANEPESHEVLLKLVDQAAYSADVYWNLEAFFLRQGYRGDADQAFINGKRRERSENLHGVGWFGSWLLDWLVGYGRRPWQAGVPCAVLVALGCVLFSPTKMEPQKPDSPPRVYSRFWYSLGLFLPFVDLQADKVWKPKAEETFLRNYMRVHILAGWILIPIVLAALTGLIK